MAKPPFPENFAEHRKEYNFRSESDYEKLSEIDRHKYELIEKQKTMELKKIKADNERYRERRIEQEKDRLLRERSMQRQGPVPVIGGKRVDGSRSVTAIPLPADEQRNIEATAERNVLQREESHLELTERNFTQAQKDMLDRALGPDRSPAQAAIPENFAEHGREFNFRSKSDYEKLSGTDRYTYEAMEVKKQMVLSQMKAKHELLRERHIEQEKQKLLRADGRADVTAKPLSAEESARLHEIAERNVLQQEATDLKAMDKALSRWQTDMLDRALGPDRYPAKER
ncbi:MAG: hypothetical protein EOM22_05270 [Gammaproteobacteria bacterium]|nr:hypothetical protein [Gammaproteobacteria bacterium]